MTHVRIGLDEVASHFQELEDPRSPVNRRHPLVSVVVISLCAVLAGAEGPTGIRTWAEEKQNWLSGRLPLPHGLPSKDVFRRVLMALKPAAFQKCFAAWLQSLKQAALDANEDPQQPKDKQQPPVLAVDGKALRGSHDRNQGLGPLHLVSVWASELGLTLAQVATEEKSNEITAIPEVLKLADVSGAIITIDAAGTQTAIAKQIVDEGGDYVMALKENQKTLYRSVAEYVDRCLETNFAGVKVRRHTTEETHHGRRETRSYMQMPVPDDLPGCRRWKKLRTIGVVVRTTERDGREVHDVQYYLSSLALGVKQFARVVRSHWSIENTCHWSLDVTYREDANRTRQRSLSENLAWLRRFTLGLLKQHPGKGSLAMKRRRCGWNENYLLDVLTTATT